jgi:hypothetical protein
MLDIVMGDTSKELPPNLIESIKNKRWKSDLERGHEEVDTVRQLCSKFDTWKGPRTINQLNMIEAFICCCAYLFYATVIDAEMQAILMYNLWTRIVQCCPVSAPRREGKTEMAALYMAAMLFFKPNIILLLVVPYSGMGNLQSGLLGRTAFFLEEIFGVKQWLVKNNKMISFKRGTVKTLRVEYNK